MGIILAFSVYFFISNRRQTKGKKVIERTVSGIYYVDTRWPTG
jgi:hypothetical protein